MSIKLGIVGLILLEDVVNGSEQHSCNGNDSFFVPPALFQVFLPRIALTYFGCARTILQVGSRILQIGIQYFPVDSIQTSVQLFSASH